MKRSIILLIILFVVGICADAQTLSPAMEKAIEACAGLSKAIGSSTTSQLKAANKTLKSVDVVNFGNLKLEKGKELSVDGHFVFDTKFVDNLIINRKVIEFSSKYVTRSPNRVTSNSDGRVKITTKALKAGKSSTWKTVNRSNAEYALVAEPGGLFTMTIRDEKGKVLYAETVDNKKGAAVRRAKFKLPDLMTRIYIEIKNNGKNDASFALIGN